MLLHRLALRNLTQTATIRCNNKLKDLLESAASGFDQQPTTPEDQWSTTPYPKEAVFDKRDQGRKAKKPNIDPRETSIILFPGQGAQYVGMAEKLLKIPESRDMFQIAKEVLGYDLLEICMKGPNYKLNQTVYAQPAIAVTSLASLERLKEARPHAIEDCVATAGFSLGEITALIFAGAIPFDKGLKLIQVRAEAMQIASEKYPSGMATVFYGPDSKLGEACVQAKEWCIEKGVEEPTCQIANYLFPHCKVVAGNLEALEFLEKNKRQFKLRKVKKLPVSGAFHTNLMGSAIGPFVKALRQIEVKDPFIHVHSCIDGKAYKNAEHIQKQLPKQIVKPVKWEQLLHIMYERGKNKFFPRTFECAPGNSLISILKEVNARASDSAISVEK
ncbi:hypothetical protein PVAND_007059 [Polypedilum vanderplanki]|uniref:[acyl-carrier-protein] S-malonyltransferase n=1 Tax=Polypedilum vanderplanki TaxID=319348 RepID=A0A9J6C5J2_POLVA|nr:hypothetical protein PVAND_007059 [Polypedilum vanderplanki]